MKFKHVFSTLILTWAVFLFNESVFACMDLKMFCNYQGMRDDLKNADEEFNMLLEPTRNPNFQTMRVVLDLILGCTCSSEEHMHILKNNPNCVITEYTKKLLKFYEANKENIIKNIQKKTLI